MELARRAERRRDRVHGRHRDRSGRRGRTTGPPARWAGYAWAEPVRVDEVVAHFWSDQPGPDAGDGVAVPQSWAVQALVDGEWRDVSDADAYPTEREAPNRVSFDPVVTTGIRVALTAQSDG